MKKDSVISTIVSISMFVILIYLILVIITPIAREEHDKQYNDYINIIGDNETPNINIEDGYFHGYDANGTLVAAHGMVNKNGLKEELKLTILPPFFRIAVRNID